MNLNAIVGDMEPILLRLMGADIDLGVVLDPHLALVKDDRGQIEQVIVNLAANARPPNGGMTTASPTVAPAEYIAASPCWEGSNHFVAR